MTVRDELAVIIRKKTWVLRELYFAEMMTDANAMHWEPAGVQFHYLKSQLGSGRAVLRAGRSYLSFIPYKKPPSLSHNREFRIMRMMYPWLLGELCADAKQAEAEKHLVSRVFMYHFLHSRLTNKQILESFRWLLKVQKYPRKTLYLEAA